MSSQLIDLGEGRARRQTVIGDAREITDSGVQLSGSRISLMKVNICGSDTGSVSTRIIRRAKLRTGISDNNFKTVALGLPAIRYPADHDCEIVSSHLIRTYQASYVLHSCLVHIDH